MFNSKGIVFLALFFAVFISGCNNDQTAGQQASELRKVAEYKLDANKTAWLRDHLPNETVAYLNIPTPWNYLFDAKADAMHPVQHLPEHIAQVEKIKQGAKDNYFQYIPPQYQGLTALLLEHTQTSLELAVINNSPGAFLPTVAIGTKLKDMATDDLVTQLNQTLGTMAPGMAFEPLDQKAIWSIQINQFPAYLQHDENSGQLLIYGGMGANEERMTALWEQKSGNQLLKIHSMSQQADPSGLNLKMWVAAAKLYQMSQAFVPPAQQQLISNLALDQMEFIWLGTESNQGQSALALHVMMPEQGWRQLLPRATDWFDVTMAGKPRSVIQMTLPTADQLKQAIEQLDLNTKMTASDREDMKVWEEISAEVGFDFYDILNAYQQQIIWVKDQSGSWFAMKTKDKQLRTEMEQSLNDYFEINTTTKSLDGVEIMQAHFSIYQKFFAMEKDLPDDAAQIEAFLDIFKEHAYWYEEDDVIYMSQVPQVLAMKKNHADQISLKSWLSQNQGSDWNSAILAYGKDIKHMPQDLYHYYLLLLQGLGDLAKVEVDLFALPTAEQLNLPESGRINLVLSSDAEKVSFKFAYEYSVLEPLLAAEGGFATIAVLGIVAAYAVPAYRDYTVRAKLGEQLAMASVLKVIVAERMANDGVINVDTFKGIENEVVTDGLDYYIDAETGTIVINLADVDDVFSSGDDLYLEPSIQDGGYIEWFCLSNVKETYLPAICKF